MNSTTAPVWCKVPKFEITKDSKLDIPAYGGRLDVKWDPGTKVTPSGGLAYFAVFLKVTGFFDSLRSDFPIDYRSNNTSSRRDIVGTIVLAILFGKDRYVQIDALRNDTASMELLGLKKIVSEDTVRRSLRDADGKALDAWLSRHEHEVVDSMLRFAYVIDIDNTVKPIFGHQEGAELGYNPQKPGRPSHNHHTFFIDGARITLGVDVLPGKQHSGVCGMRSLWAFLDAIPRHLFKIKRTGLAKEFFASLSKDDGWTDCGCGREGREHRIRLSTWKLARRCIFIRRPNVPKSAAIPSERAQLPAPDSAKPVPAKGPRQLEFDFAKDRKVREWDYCILVTNEEKLDLTALSQAQRTANPLRFISFCPKRRFRQVLYRYKVIKPLPFVGQPSRQESSFNSPLSATKQLPRTVRQPQSIRCGQSIPERPLQPPNQQEDNHHDRPHRQIDQPVIAVAHRLFPLTGYAVDSTNHKM